MVVHLEITQSQQIIKVEEESIVTGKIRSWRNKRYKDNVLFLVKFHQLATIKNPMQPLQRISFENFEKNCHIS